MSSSLVTRFVRGRQEPDRLLVLIHGRGASEHDLEPLIGHLDPEARFLAVLPRAPLALMPGWEWYRADGIGTAGPELVSSVDAVDDLLDEACVEHGFAREQAVVAGFSQGCAVALTLGLRRSDRPRPAGVLGMSGFLPERDGLDYDFATGPPAFIQHGSADPVIPAAYGREAVTRLSGGGVPVVYREYPMGHQVSPESLRDAMTWLALVVTGDRPAEPVPDFAAS